MELLALSNIRNVSIKGWTILILNLGNWIFSLNPSPGRYRVGIKSSPVWIQSAFANSFTLSAWLFIHSYKAIEFDIHSLQKRTCDIEDYYYVCHLIESVIKIKKAMYLNINAMSELRQGITWHYIAKYNILLIHVLLCATLVHPWTWQIWFIKIDIHY